MNLPLRRIHQPLLTVHLTADSHNATNQGRPVSARLIPSPFVPVPIPFGNLSRGGDVVQPD